MTVKELIEILQNEVEDKEKEIVVSYGGSNNVTVRHISTIHAKDEKIYLL